LRSIGLLCFPFYGRWVAQTSAVKKLRYVSGYCSHKLLRLVLVITYN